MNLFPSLPDEIVTQILSHLDHTHTLGRVSQVDRRFRRLSRDPSVWRSLDLPLDDPWEIEEIDLEELLEISGLARPDGTSLALRAMREHPGNVTRIRIQFPTGSSERQEVFLTGLGQFGESVKTLDVSGDVDGEVLISHVQSLKHLVILRLESTRRLTSELLIAVGATCAGLRVSTFRCHEVGDAGMDALIDGIQGTLQELDIDASRCTGESIKNLAKCQLLRRLDIVWPRRNQAGGEVLAAILELPRLESLSLDVSLVHRYERLNRSSDFTNAFGGRTLGLLKLELPYTNLNDAALEVIANSCQELRDINIRYTKVTCAGLRMLLMTCQNLSKVKLSVITRWSMSSFVRAFRDARAPLRTLECYEYYLEDRVGMRTIERLMPNLEIIGVSFDY